MKKDKFKQDKPVIRHTLLGLTAFVLFVLAIVLPKTVLAQTTAQSTYVNDSLEYLSTSLQAYDVERLITVDLAAQRIIVSRDIFTMVGDCMLNSADDVFILIGQEIAEFLRNYPNEKVFITGHTDNVQRFAPAKDAPFLTCMLYVNNYALSAARAAEVRKRVITTLSTQESKRVIAAGLGDAFPLANKKPEHMDNRRVEILFTGQAL